MTSVLAISNEECKEILGMTKAIEVLEEAFRLNAQGKYITFPVIREKLWNSGIFGIKSGTKKSESSLIGLKAGGYWPNNPTTANVSAHQSTILLFDSETGQSKALLGANYITGLRTGAAGAVAAKYLARKDSSKVAVFGSGIQSEMQMRALISLFTIEEITVYSPVKESLLDFEKRTNDLEGIKFNFISQHSDMREPVQKADIIVTTTPSFEYVLPDSWVSSGTHINAIGADTKGKQEIEPTLFKRTVTVVDSYEQCSVMGDLQHAVAQGFVTNADVTELSDVILNPEKGRVSADQITLFDATGIYLEDLAVAEYIYSTALRQNIGIEISI